MIFGIPGRRIAWSIVPVRSFLLATMGSLLLQSASGQMSTPPIEQAPSLAALVAQLSAQAAQASSHLELDVPDVAVPGAVQIRASSQIPGTSMLVLARGAFTATVSPVGQEQPRIGAPVRTPRTLGEAPSTKAPPPVWIASHYSKAGQPAVLHSSLTVDRTGSVTLFALAQGRWWFVTREIKVGQAAHSASAASRPAAAPSSP